MKIAVVDDEQEMRSQLSGYIARFAQEGMDSQENGAGSYDVTEFPSGAELQQDDKAVYDIIILDIDMPGINGMDTARQIRRTDSDVVIIFVTNMAQYAINGYEVEAVDYIIKPVGYYDFALKFQRALRHVVRERKELIAMNTTKGIVHMDVAEIIYVEAMAHYLIFHTASRDLEVRGSMKEQERTLARYRFSRAHKSFLVNLRHIDTVRSGEVIVEGRPIPLGRAYRDSLMSDYMQYMGE